MQLPYSLQSLLSRCLTLVPRWPLSGHWITSKWTWVKMKCWKIRRPSQFKYSFFLFLFPFLSQMVNFHCKNYNLSTFEGQRCNFWFCRWSEKEIWNPTLDIQTHVYKTPKHCKYLKIQQQILSNTIIRHIYSNCGISCVCKFVIVYVLFGLCFCIHVSMV